MDSEIEDFVVNNQKRYTVKIPYFYKHNDYILYQAEICDCAFFHKYTLTFRFKTLKNLHAMLLKKVSPDQIPEYPKTNSVWFWNRTNDSLTLIKERIRQLQFYLSKLLNNLRLKRVREVQQIFNAFEKQEGHRAHSVNCNSWQPVQVQFCKECPELYHRDPSHFLLSQ